MTYEEKKKLIEAAKVVLEHCMKRKNAACGDCPFYDCGCSLDAKFPTYWDIPTFTRWTPEDVALAKALRDYGVAEIYRGEDNHLYCFDNKGKEITKIHDYSMAFREIKKNFAFTIDTIIKEAEE